MISGNFLALTFEDEDRELWEALNKIPIETRNQYIKNILKTNLLKKAETDQTCSPVKSAQGPDRCGLNLEALLIPPKVNPLENLFKNVIGVEEDEEVINFLKNSSSSDKNNNQISNKHSIVDEKDNNDIIKSAIEISTEEMSLEELFIKNPVNTNEQNIMPGLDYLLNQIIGEESDETLITFLNQSIK